MTVLYEKHTKSVFETSYSLGRSCGRHGDDRGALEDVLVLLHEGLLLAAGQAVVQTLEVADLGLQRVAQVLRPAPIQTPSLGDVQLPQVGHLEDAAVT